MMRRLRNAWLVLSLLWIAYAIHHAFYYWNRWGSFIAPENYLSVFLTTALEILAPPAAFGLVLGAAQLTRYAVRRLAR